MQKRTSLGIIGAAMAMMSSAFGRGGSVQEIKIPKNVIPGGGLPRFRDAANRKTGNKWPFTGKNRTQRANLNGAFWAMR